MRLILFRRSVRMLLSASWLAVVASAQAQLGTAFTYQGRLQQLGAGANGSYDFRFILFTADLGGSQIGPIQTNSAVAVQSGLFTTEIDFGVNAFTGGERWLEIYVRTNGSGTFTLLTPRQPVRPTPYAMHAVNAATATTALGVAATAQPVELRVNGERGLRIEAAGDSPVDTNSLSDGTVNVIGGSYSNFVAPGVVGATIAGGGAANLDGRPYMNSVVGHWGSVLGGLSNSASTFAVAGGGVFNAASGSAATVVGGNRNTASGQHAFVGGGFLNNAGGNSSVIGGGVENMASAPEAVVVGGAAQIASGTNSFIGGGWVNTASGEYSTIGGGAEHDATGAYSVIAGGYFNKASARFSSALSGNDNETLAEYSTIAGGQQNSISAAGFATTISGGSQNTASGDYSSIVGGRDNTASGYGSCIAGGSDNVASGTYAFAGGRRARADDNGAFVWADNNDFDFNSTAANGFFVRSIGGVRFTTGINASGGSTAGVRVVAGGGSWESVSDRNAKEGFKPVNTSEVLEKVAALPIQEWAYKASPGQRHVGPIAQDFHAAFGLGSDEKHIASVDADGVALAAIQGLNQKLDSENRSLRAELAELRAAVAELKVAVGSK
jgi:trimeric autotransporter adhesin